MKQFCKTVVLFLLPLLLFFLPSLLIFCASGEAYSLERIALLARGPHPLIAGQAYSNYRQAYQLQETIFRKPTVLALGSSRVGQFSQDFFVGENSFYNAAGAIDAMSSYTYFLSALKVPPKMLLVSMDQYYFSPENAKNRVVERPNPFVNTVRSYDTFMEGYFRNGGWWKVYKDFLTQKYTLKEIFADTGSVKEIGLRTHATGDGYTNDGSDYYGNILESSSTGEEVTRTIHAMKDEVTDDAGYEYDTSVSEDAISELRIFLAACKKSNITVVGFLPPISHEVYTALQAHPEATYYKSFKELPDRLRAVYADYGFSFYDMSDIATYGGSDSEFVESKHGSQKLYARLLIAIASKNTQLKSFVAVPRIEEALQTATSSYQLFPLVQ